MSDTEEPVQNGFHDADAEVGDEDVEQEAAVKTVSFEQEEEAEDEQVDDTGAADEETSDTQVPDSDDTGAVTEEAPVAEETTQAEEEPEEAASNQDADAVTVKVLEGGDDTVAEEDAAATEEQATSEEPVQEAVEDLNVEACQEEPAEEDEPHVEDAPTPASPARLTPRTPKSAATPTPRSSKAAFDFDEAKDSGADTPRTPRTPRTPKTPAEPKVETPTDEPANVPGEEETTETATEVPASDEGNVETVNYEVEETEPAKDEAPPTPIRTRRKSPSPPPRRGLGDSSSSQAHRRDEPSPNEYVPYDQETHKKTIPIRPPTSASFSSWMPAEKPAYQALSPWTVNPAHKYRNEYTSGSTYRPSSTYTSVFDDLVSVGPFAQNLYSTSRMVERSRSRTRERKNALRSHRSASNYFRYTSQGPPPTRTREYSTPPSAYVSRAPSRSGSFASFMDFSSAKQYDLARTASRTSLQERTNALSRSSSRSDVPYWSGGGGLSRVDSFVRNIQNPYEANVPSSYDTYRPSSRYSLAYTPMNTYSRYYDTTDSVLMQLRSAYERRRPVLVHNAYWSHVTDLQRSLSRDRYTPRSRYTSAAYPYEHGTKPADLYGISSYSHMRSGSVPRTSAYSSYSPSYQTSVYPTMSTVDNRRSRLSTAGLRSSGRETYNRWQQGNILAGMSLYNDQPYVERRPYTQSFRYF